jgi:hypothetical protein
MFQNGIIKYLNKLYENLPKEPEELALKLIQDLEAWIQEKIPGYTEEVFQ